MKNQYITKERSKKDLDDYEKQQLRKLLEEKKEPQRDKIHQFIKDYFVGIVIVVGAIVALLTVFKVI